MNLGGGYYGFIVRAGFSISVTSFQFLVWLHVTIDLMHILLKNFECNYDFIYFII